MLVTLEHHIENMLFLGRLIKRVSKFNNPLDAQNQLNSLLALVRLNSSLLYYKKWTVEQRYTINDPALLGQFFMFQKDMELFMENLLSAATNDQAFKHIPNVADRFSILNYIFDGIEQNFSDFKLNTNTYLAKLN